MATKVCAKCRTEKPVGDFYRRSEMGSLHSWCKKCEKEYKQKEIVCQECGKIALRYKGAKYCSRECACRGGNAIATGKHMKKLAFTIEGLGPRKQLWEIPSAGSWEEKNLRRGKEDAI